MNSKTKVIESLSDSLVHWNDVLRVQCAISICVLSDVGVGQGEGVVAQRTNRRDAAGTTETDGSHTAHEHAAGLPAVERSIVDFCHAHRTAI